MKLIVGKKDHCARQPGQRNHQGWRLRSKSRSDGQRSRITWGATHVLLWHRPLSVLFQEILGICSHWFDCIWSLVSYLHSQNQILLYFSSLSIVAILVCESHRQVGSSTVASTLNDFACHWIKLLSLTNLTEKKTIKSQGCIFADNTPSSVWEFEKVWESLREWSKDKKGECLFSDNQRECTTLAKCKQCKSDIKYCKPRWKQIIQF